MHSLKIVVAAMLLAAVGCADGPDLVPVSGRVTLNGAPLAGARVNTQPIGTVEQPNPGPGSWAETDQDGYYSLELATNDRSGAVVGEHRVTVVMEEDAYSADPTSDLPDAPSRPWPREFTDGSLRITVPEGGTDQANLELTLK